MRKRLPRNYFDGTRRVSSASPPAELKTSDWLAGLENLIPRLVKIMHGVRILVADAVIIFWALSPGFHRL